VARTYGAAKKVIRHGKNINILLHRSSLPALPSYESLMSVFRVVS